jgi:type IV pilus assembly protein PilY1
MLIHRNGKLWFAAATLLLGVGLAALAAPTTAVAQDECEVPLFIKQSSGGANVMILADNSFSMNTAIYHFSYDKTIVWPGPFDSDAIYFVAKDGWYEPNDFNSSYAGGTLVYLVNSDNGEDGRYPGNYMNWIYYHTTDTQRMFVPSVTRIQVLKAVMLQIIDRSAQLKMGVTVI